MRDQELFFDVRKVQQEGDGEPRLEVTAGTLNGFRDGRQVATGDIRMYLPASAEKQSSVSGRMAFPNCADMEFEGGLEAMRALWMAAGAKADFLRDPRFSFWRL